MSLNLHFGVARLCSGLGLFRDDGSALNFSALEVADAGTGRDRKNQGHPEARVENVQHYSAPSYFGIRANTRAGYLLLISANDSP